MWDQYCIREITAIAFSENLSLLANFPVPRLTAYIGAGNLLRLSKAMAEILSLFPILKDSTPPWIMTSFGKIEFNQPGIYQVCNLSYQVKAGDKSEFIFPVVKALSGAERDC